MRHADSSIPLPSLASCWHCSHWQLGLHGIGSNAAHPVAVLPAVMSHCCCSTASPCWPWGEGAGGGDRPKAATPNFSVVVVVVHRSNHAGQLLCILHCALSYVGLAASSHSARTAHANRKLVEGNWRGWADAAGQRILYGPAWPSPRCSRVKRCRTQPSLFRFPG